jgi:hypothetical protein
VVERLIVFALAALAMLMGPKIPTFWIQGGSSSFRKSTLYARLKSTCLETYMMH